LSKLVRNAFDVAFMLLLGHCAPAVQADEPVLRLDDDFVVPLVRIAPGTFEMGRSSRGALTAAALSLGEQGDWATEGPVRKVTISKPFLIGKYKITAEQFCRFLNSTDAPERSVGTSQFSHIEQRDGKYHAKEGLQKHPANVVDWEGAATFCEWLSKESAQTVRLPTEAEWEYVARGAAGRRRPWGNKEVSDWSSIEGAAVDAFPENSTPEGVIGLVDRVVGEWCSDFYGVRYLPGDMNDPQGPSKDQLPVKSDLLWLATVPGEYHVLRGRVKRPGWSTTARDLGDRATAGIYGFRIVVETGANEDER
jgi:formylglycine-generating enzyme required for sulfatase activity